MTATLQYRFKDELTGSDVQFDPQADILIELHDPTGQLPTIYIDGTPVDNPFTRKVIRAINALRFEENQCEVKND